MLAAAEVAAAGWYWASAAFLVKEVESEGGEWEARLCMLQLEGSVSKERMQ